MPADIIEIEIHSPDSNHQKLLSLGPGQSLVLADGGWGLDMRSRQPDPGKTVGCCWLAINSPLRDIVSTKFASYLQVADY